MGHYFLDTQYANIDLCTVGSLWAAQWATRTEEILNPVTYPRLQEPSPSVIFNFATIL